MAKKIRVLVAKPGLDGHDRGAKVVANALRDAGMEVIYTGLHQTPEMIAEAAIQEDVDVIGLSILSGAHMTMFPRIMELLEQKGADHIRIFGGLGFNIALPAQRLGHAFAVIDIHLTAIGLDKQLLRFGHETGLCIRWTGVVYMLRTPLAMRAQLPEFGGTFQQDKTENSRCNTIPSTIF